MWIVEPRQPKARRQNLAAISISNEGSTSSLYSLLHVEYQRELLRCGRSQLGEGEQTSGLAAVVEQGQRGSTPQDCLFTTTCASDRLPSHHPSPGCAAQQRAS
jgi:hypothetical protein